jgi:hypothetical protein
MRNTRYSYLLLLAMTIILIPAASHAQVSVGVSIAVAPPALPIYSQPVCPGDGYIWTPGYWAYGPDGYYWVPGTWVEPPEIGFLWTPGYWGWGGGGYIWHVGYWGPHVGFYGGIDYGFGYVGVGYQGGYWNHDRFAYNRAVNNVNVAFIHNTYNRTVVNSHVNRVSYNGGRGGINARPTSAQEAAIRDRHVGATAAQLQQRQVASTNRGQLASVNSGRPEFAATVKPGEFNRSETAPAESRAPAGNFNRPTTTTRPSTTVPEHNTVNRSKYEMRSTTETRPTTTARPSTTVPERNTVNRPKNETRPNIETHPTNTTRPTTTMHEHSTVNRPNNENRHAVESHPSPARPSTKNPVNNARSEMAPRPNSTPRPTHTERPTPAVQPHPAGGGAEHHGGEDRH